METVEVGSIVQWRETSTGAGSKTYTRRIIGTQDFAERMERAIEALGPKPNPRSVFEARATMYGEFMEHAAPVAQGLLTKAVGDTVEVDTPAGLKRIRILSIG